MKLIVPVVIERHRQVGSKAGGGALLELDQDALGDGRQVELTGLVEIDPDELDELGVRSDDATDFAGNRLAIHREEPRVEAPGPTGRRDGAGDEAQRREIRHDAVANEL